MADYLVRIQGHMKLGLHPKLPDIASHSVIARVDNIESLQEITNKEAAKIVYQGGMIVSKEPLEIQDLMNPKLDTRMFIPLANFAFIDTHTVPIVAGGLDQIDFGEDDVKVVTQ